VIRSIRCCLVLVLVLAAAACGETRQVREPDLVVEGDAPAAPSAPESAPSTGGETLRISVVTHGQAANPFWVIVRNGIDAAARQLDVSVSYRAPDTYSVARMRTLIDAAVAGRPDGLVVSIPSPGVEGSIRRAIDAGIPVISINSGSHAYRRLGVLAHVGQPEQRAGAAAGARLARAGVRRALCVNQERGNVGLVLRCRGFIRALRRAGGDGDVLAVDVPDRAATRQRLTEAIRSQRTDGVLTLDTLGADAALDAVRSEGPAGTARLATFDLSPEVLQAVRDGRMRFAVDQQAYMQGYLPVVLLTQRIRYGLFAAEGKLLATGPTFVTRATADRILRLSERGIR
jgi:simple sugar transport system substrate-binding protein